MRCNATIFFCIFYAFEYLTLATRDVRNGAGIGGIIDDSVLDVAIGVVGFG